MNSSSFIELSALQEEIKKRLGLLECWVKVEIESHREVGGHHYINVLQKDENGAIAAKASAKIWRYNAAIISNFRHLTGKDIEPGISIVVYAKVEYHAVYGISLIISDIDSTYTLGQRELEKRQTIQRLTESGTMQWQKDLSLPYLPVHIAVITSPSAAGYGDFVKHLQGNARGFVFRYTLLESLVQGDNAPASIMRQLNAVQKAGCYDMVLLMRGGGAESDMFCFDDYELCKAIASCPVPVLTAIGHERDYHVADMVSHSYYKTPTALADFLIEWTAAVEDTMAKALSDVRQALMERFAREERQILELVSNIRYHVSDGVNSMERRVQDLQAAIAGSMTNKLLLSNREVQRSLSTISFAIMSLLNNSDAQVALMESRIKSSDPRDILRQGYLLAVGDDGNILKNAETKSVGDIFTLLFTDGCWRCAINEVKPKTINNK